jgi:murein DD-endopeptidase MepM/ murein hydrolase activator NlpD
MKGFKRVLSRTLVTLMLAALLGAGYFGYLRWQEWQWENSVTSVEIFDRHGERMATIEDEGIQDWLQWYKGIQGVSAISDATKETEGLLWHSVTFTINEVKERFDVYLRDDYFVVSGVSATIKVPHYSVWFDFYMDDASLSRLYESRRLGLYKVMTADQNTIIESSFDQWYYVNGQLKSVPIESKENTIRQEAPLVILREGEELTLEGLEAGDEVYVEAFDGETLIFNEYIKDGRIRPMTHNQVITYSIRIQRDSPKTGTLIDTKFGKTFFDFDVFVEINPVVHIPIKKTTAGGFFTVGVDHVPTGYRIELKQKLVDDVLWHRRLGGYYTVLPLIYWINPGMYPVEVWLVPEKSDDLTKSTQLLSRETLEVTARVFDVQRLTIDPNIEASTRNDAAYEEYNTYFLPVRNQGIEEQLWEGPFIMPVEGRLTTKFGMRRSVNGSLTTYRHNGIDLAAPTGTPILASNTGEVVLSREFILVGNAIIIDHGLGLFTVYLHLDERYVKEGERVSKGSVIGTVGSTGFSTGPHLHFTTSYYRTNLDPFIFTDWQAIFQETAD